MAVEPFAQPADRYDAVKQYSLRQILAVWAAAAIPMGGLSWIVAPWLSDRLSGREPLAEALLICLAADLIWQFVLVLILIRRELSTTDADRAREQRSPQTWRGLGLALAPSELVVARGCATALAAHILLPSPHARRGSPHDLHKG